MWSFYLSFPLLPFVFAISFFPFSFFCCCSFLLGAVCTISVLSPLPKHWDHCSSFPNIVRLILNAFDRCFPPCIASCFKQSWEESVRRSDSPEITETWCESSVLGPGQENGLITGCPMKCRALEKCDSLQNP